MNHHRSTLLQAAIVSHHQQCVDFHWSENTNWKCCLSSKPTRFWDCYYFCILGWSSKHQHNPFVTIPGSPKISLNKRISCCVYMSIRNSVHLCFRSVAHTNVLPTWDTGMPSTICTVLPNFRLHPRKFYLKEALPSLPCQYKHHPENNSPNFICVPPSSVSHSSICPLCPPSSFSIDVKPRPSEIMIAQPFSLSLSL